MTPSFLNVYVTSSAINDHLYWPSGNTTMTTPYTTMATTTGGCISPNQLLMLAMRQYHGSGTPACSDEWLSDPQYSPPSNRVTVADGQDFHVKLPDGTEIEVKTDGSYEIKDADAKVIYRANRVREFNRFVNASDVLEGFIRFCGAEAQVHKEDMLELPIRLFIGWLILEAAKADKEPAPDDIKLLPDLRRAVEPRCRSCGRFLRRALKLRRLEFCGTTCFEKQLIAP